MAQIDVLEGSLRREVGADGGIDYWCEIAPHGITIKREINDCRTPKEARTVATRIEIQTLSDRTRLKNREMDGKEVCRREAIGTPLESNIGVFLIKHLKIDLDTLSAEQNDELLMLILNLSSPGENAIPSSTANAASKKLADALTKLNDVADVLDNLPVKPASDLNMDADGGTIWGDFLKLEQRLVIAQRNLNTIAEDHGRTPVKEFVSGVLIRAFLRWMPDWRRRSDLGISYPEDWKTKYSTTANDAYDSQSPLMAFLSAAVGELGETLPNWDFSPRTWAAKHRTMKDKENSEIGYRIVRQ